MADRLGSVGGTIRWKPGWTAEGLPEFGLGIGVSTGEAAAALLGSEEQLEYTLVGDTVNLSQRVQQLGSAGETVISEEDLYEDWAAALREEARTLYVSVARALARPAAAAARPRLSRPLPPADS
jgi:class 3 adenylate cyclase